MAADMFLKLGDIKGESADSKYKEWIDILSWSWGMTQSGSMHIGGGGGAGKVDVQDVSLVKYVDSATSNVMLKCMTGKHYPQATLVVRKAGDQPLDYVTIVMDEVMITSYSTGGSGGEDRLTENVSLNFAKVKVTYKPQKADGSLGADMVTGYNMKQNTTI